MVPGIVFRLTKGRFRPLSITQSGLRWNSSQATSAELKPYFITTPIFYVNADPHIGHLYSDVIADVLARYQTYARSGYSRFDRAGLAIPASQFASAEAAAPGVKAFLCTGTDEHGLKIQKVAEAAGQDPQKLCDRISSTFRELAVAGNIDYTTFIRTTDPEHKLAVHHLWKTMLEQGYIYKGSHAGWYAVSDEAFYTETQVYPHVINTETGETQMRSIETGATVEWSSEENYKFRLSAFREPLLQWLKNDPRAIQPAQKHAEVMQEIENGLEDLSISRPSNRLSWGIPVPDDPEHSIYVWVDALTNYITVTGYPWDQRGTKRAVVKTNTDAWPADVHVVGKDIIRFHAIYWPAFLMAAKLPLPKTVLAHAHWTMNKSKMSKSRGNVANPFEAIDTFGLDALRFFLIRIGGNFGSDADYSPNMLIEFHRKYLQGQLGNLLSRVLAPKLHARIAQFGHDPTTKMVRRLPKSSIEPHVKPEDLQLLESLETNLLALPAQFDALMEQFELAKATVLITESIIGQANALLHRLEPWSPHTPDEVSLETVVLLTETLRISALLLHPVMPGKMSELLDDLQIPQDMRTSYARLIVTDSAGRLVSHVVSRDPTARKIKPLFPKIEIAPEL